MQTFGEKNNEKTVKKSESKIIVAGERRGSNASRRKSMISIAGNIARYFDIFFLSISVTFFSKLSLKKSGTDLNKSEDDEDLPEATDASIREMNSPELAYNIIGVIVSLAVGGVQPLFAIMFSEILRQYSIHFFQVYS